MGWSCGWVNGCIRRGREGILLGLSWPSGSRAGLEDAFSSGVKTSVLKGSTVLGSVNEKKTESLQAIIHQHKKSDTSNRRGGMALG